MYVLFVLLVSTPLPTPTLAHPLLPLRRPEIEFDDTVHWRFLYHCLA